jgi:hypothetical protein
MRVLLPALLALVAWPVQATDTIPNSKAAEFSLHRIERLVILHKIDRTFQTHFERIDLTMETPNQPSDPTFLIRASQVGGADGSRMTMDLAFDQIVRPMKDTVNPGGSPSANPPAWPQADAITIAEDSLHWIEDQGPVVDELRSFYQGVVSLALSPVTDAQGALTAAEVAMVVSRDKPSLLVTMGLDGVFKSYEILPPVRN